MKKLILLISLMVVFGCCTVTYNDSIIVITSVSRHEDHCHYNSEQGLYFRDDCNLFKVGDTISIQKVRK